MLIVYLIFAGAVPYLEKERVSDNWSLVKTSDGMYAWLDRESGLIWSDPIEWTKPDPPRIEEAKAFCRSQSPDEYWALPTAAECLLFRENGGEEISPSGSRGT